MSDRYIDPDSLGIGAGLVRTLNCKYKYTCICIYPLFASRVFLYFSVIDHSSTSTFGLSTQDHLLIRLLALYPSIALFKPLPTMVGKTLSQSYSILFYSIDGSKLRFTYYTLAISKPSVQL